MNLLDEYTLVVDNVIEYVDELDTTNDILYYDLNLSWVDFRVKLNPSLNPLIWAKTNQFDKFRPENVFLHLNFDKPTTLVYDITNLDKVRLNGCLEKFLRLKDQFYKNTEVILLKKRDGLKFSAIRKVNTNLEDFVELGYHEYFTNLKTLLSEDAKGKGIKSPKSALLVGFPGTGKTLSAKYCANVLDRDLYELDIANTYNNLVGDSEKALKEALDFVSDKECVFFIDELDKFFQASDNGTSQKMLSVLLSWLSDQHKCFILLSANRVSDIPIETLRKGRVDSVIKVNLPDSLEIDRILDKLNFKGERQHLYSSSMTHSEVTWYARKHAQNAYLNITKPIHMKVLAKIKPQELKEMEEWAMIYES
jgi:hypothetical protein